MPGMPNMHVQRAETRQFRNSVGTDVKTGLACRAQSPGRGHRVARTTRVRLRPPRRCPAVGTISSINKSAGITNQGLNLAFVASGDCPPELRNLALKNLPGEPAPCEACRRVTLRRAETCLSAGVRTLRSVKQERVYSVDLVDLRVLPPQPETVAHGNMLTTRWKL